MKRGPRYWANLLGFALLLTGLAAAGGILWIAHARVMAYIQPPRQHASARLLEEHQVSYEEIQLHTEDGLRLHAWYTPPKNGILILLAHGHGGAIPVDYYLIFAERGYGVLAWDFRAHGQSEGKWSTLGLKEALDVKAALDFAEQQPGVKRVGAWGGSMGAAALIHAAAQYPGIEALVSDSGYTTLKEVADMRTGIPGMGPFVRLFGWLETGADLNQMKPVEDISHISPRAVFLIQGLSDTTIPPHSAERLYDAAGEPKQIWLESNVGHLGMYPRKGDQYIERVIEFFEKYLARP